MEPLSNDIYDSVLRLQHLFALIFSLIMSIVPGIYYMSCVVNTIYTYT